LWDQVVDCGANEHKRVAAIERTQNLTSPMTALGQVLLVKDFKHCTSLFNLRWCGIP